MLRLLLLLTLPFFFSAALAAPTPVSKAEPFEVHLILKAVDGRALRHSYKAGEDLETVPIGRGTTMTVIDWNGVELVAGDVISLGDTYFKVFLARLAGSQKLAWQTTQTKPQTRFVLRKVEGADGSPIASGDRVRLQLFGEKDSYLSSNAELVHVTTPGPEQTWLVRRETYGDQAARKLYDEASRSSGDPAKSKAMYEEAFQKGALDAAGAIGDMYLDGKFGSKDLTQGVAYYRKGAEAGVPSAMYMYGVALYNGKGVSENKREGVRWEQMASQAGYWPAMDQLKEWREPLGGVAVAAVPKPAEPPQWKPKYPPGQFFVDNYNDPLAVVLKVDPANKSYLVLSRKYIPKQEPYFLFAEETGHYRLTEDWVSEEALRSFKTTSDSYRSCENCGGAGCQFDEVRHVRGGQWEQISSTVKIYTPQRVSSSYKKKVNCSGCGNQGWLKVQK